MQIRVSLNISRLETGTWKTVQRVLCFQHLTYFHVVSHCILRTFFSTNCPQARKNPRSNGYYESHDDTFNRNPNDVQIDQDAIRNLIERRRSIIIRRKNLVVLPRKNSSHTPIYKPVT